jgi:RHS repeat-associated protein
MLWTSWFPRPLPGANFTPYQVVQFLGSTTRDGTGGDPAETVQFIHDGDHIALAFDGNDDLIRRFLHGPVIDQILAEENVAEDELLWMLADNLGSVRTVVDNDSTVINHITYSAFGALTGETNPVDQFFYFTGRELDKETGDQYNRRRFYASDIGQWRSQDPIGFEAGDANDRRYVGNAPTINADPSGLFASDPQLTPDPQHSPDKTGYVPDPANPLRPLPHQPSVLEGTIFDPKVKQSEPVDKTDAQAPPIRFPKTSGKPSDFFSGVTGITKEGGMPVGSVRLDLPDPAWKFGIDFGIQFDLDGKSLRVWGRPKTFKDRPIPLQ